MLNTIFFLVCTSFVYYLLNFPIRFVNCQNIQKGRIVSSPFSKGVFTTFGLNIMSTLFAEKKTNEEKIQWSENVPTSLLVL